MQVLDAAQVHWAVPQALRRYYASLVVPPDEGELILVHVERAELRARVCVYFQRGGGGGSGK